MAADSDFKIGAVISCRTSLGREVECEVQGFDAATRMLILKSEATSGRPSLNDVHMLNLDYVSNVKIKKGVRRGERPPEPLSLNIARLHARAR